jgi:hypothetical protein
MKMTMRHGGVWCGDLGFSTRVQEGFLRTRSLHEALTTVFLVYGSVAPLLHFNVGQEE